jgi:hypothetical protein
MVSKPLAQEHGIFHTIYIERINHKNPKPPCHAEISEHLSGVRAMGFILCPESPPKMYKIEFALKSEKNMFQRLAEENGVSLWK